MQLTKLSSLRPYLAINKKTKRSPRIHMMIMKKYMNKFKR